MGKNKKSKFRRSSGVKSAQLADSVLIARSSSETIRPCRRHTPAESETSKTTTSASAPGPDIIPNTTDEGDNSSEPVAHIETAGEVMENFDRQTAEGPHEGLASAPGGEQPKDANTPHISLMSPPGTAPSDDAAAPEDAGSWPHSPSTEAQPENLVARGHEQRASEPEASTTVPNQTGEANVKSIEEDPDAGSRTAPGETQSEFGVAANDGSQSNDDDMDMEMVLHMEKGREGGLVNDSDSELGSKAGGNSEVDAAEGEEDHTEEHERGQEDPGTEQNLLPHIQEPLDSEQNGSQKLHFELKDSSQDHPMRLDPGTSQQVFPATGGEPQGLRQRRPSANNLTIAVDSQTSPVTVIEARPRTVRDLLLQKGHFVEEDSRASRAIASVADYIDGVGGRPSREDMEALEEFTTYAAERVKVLEEILESEEPMDALQRFDQQWQQKSIDEAWGGRQDLRLAAVRAAMYVRQDDGNMQGELAIMYFEHKVAELREKLGDDFDDPVALQTLEILRAGRG